MEYNINLSKNECDFILNALQYLQSKTLNNSLREIKNIKYESVKGLYADENSFKNDMEYKEKSIKEQIQAIDKIVEKIENKIYGEN